MPGRLAGRNDPRAKLAVRCWCEAEVVHVEAVAIRAGQTGSCGRPGCHAPAEASR